MVGKLYIYAKDGSTRCVLNKWEFHDTFMGEQYLQFDKESAVQIDFEVGDYAIYRDERFEINVKPTCEQVSRPESGGVAFKYQSVKMDSLKNELTKCSLLDITPTTYQYVSSEGTNYTGSTNFTMYCIETTVTMKKSDGTTVNVLLHPVEYLCGVIQANLDRLYGRENGWQILVNPEAEKSDDVVLNVSNWSCEQALAEVHNTFKLDYEVRGRTIRVGYSLQNITGLGNDAFLFGYGKGYAQHGDDGHSLISVKRTSNSSQQIVTRLRVMGSAKNMPYRYYNKKYSLPQSLFVENLQLPNTYVGTGIKYDVPGLRKVMGDTNDAYIEKDDDAASSEEGVVEGFAAWDGSNSDLKEIYPTIKEATYYELRRADGVTDIDGIGGTTAFPHYGDDERIDQILSVGSTCNFGSGIMPEADVVGETGETKDVTYNTSLNSSQFHTNGSVYIGPQLHICSFERMYLPGKYTLSMTNENVFAEFGKVAGYDPGYQISIWLGSVAGGKDTLLYYYNKRGKNSALTQRDKVQIDNLPVGASDSIELTTEGYISVYIEPLYFKRANDPFVFTGMPFGIVSDQAGIEPHMIWNYLDAADTFVNTSFNIVLKDLGFDIRTLEKATDDTPKIHVNTGACAGRDFEISLSDAEVVTVGNKKGWNVRVVARFIDNSIKRYFPSENDPLVAGDDYVITGIAMPDAYIKMAEVRLLRAATDYLADNCDTKYVYEPQLDSVYVQRNYDNNVAAGTPEKSVYMNLYAGLKFSMYGLPVADGYELIENVTIQSVNIKEGESNVPSVEIVLNNDIDQTTIEKITTSVDRIYGSIFGKNANVLSSAQTNATLISLINKEGSKHFLSKEANDEAQGFIGFVKGIWIKAKELFGFDGEGNIKANNIDAAGDVVVGGSLTALNQTANNIQSTNYSGDGIADTGWKLTNDNNGHSKLTIDELYVRMKAVFESLEVKKELVSGGNQVQSCAASVISKVDYLNGNKDILGYDEYKVPFTLRNAIMMLAKGQNPFSSYSRTRKVRLQLTAADRQNVRYVRCYFLAKEGDREIQNWWRVADQNDNSTGNDMARCQTFNLASDSVSERDTYWGGSTTKIGNIFWWRKLAGVSTIPVEIDGKMYHYFDVYCNPTAEVATPYTYAGAMQGSDIPAPGDEVSQWGNDNNIDRMNLIVHEVNGQDAAIKMYEGVNQFSMENGLYGNPLKIRFAPKTGCKVHTTKWEVVTENFIAPIPVECGNWVAGTVAKYYEIWQYGGSSWLCVASNGGTFKVIEAFSTYSVGDTITQAIYDTLNVNQQMCCARLAFGTTTDEPSTTSAAWRQYAAKGEKGDNAIRIDIDNEYDSIQYQGDGTTKVSPSGTVQTTAYLFDGITDKSSDATFTISNRSGMSDQQATISGRVVTVSGLTSDGEVTIRAEYPANSGKYYYAKFTVKKLIGIDKYDLVVTPNAVPVNTSNTVADTAINVQVYRTPANGGTRHLVEFTNKTTNDYGLTLSVKDSLNNNLIETTGTGTVTTRTFNLTGTMAINADNVMVVLTKDSKTQDAETIPITHVHNGIDGSGSNAVKIDLDNEMDSIPCDSDGKVMSQTVLEVNARIYDGAAPVTSGVAVGSVGAIAGVSAVTSISNGVVNIKWTIPATGSGTPLSVDKYTSQIVLTWGGNSYYTTFTANVVKSGEPGVSPTIFQLLPSPSQISFKRDSGGSIPSSTQTLSLSIKKSDENGTSVITVAASGLTVCYRTDQAPSSASDGTAWPAAGLPVSSSVTYSNVYIAAFDGSTLVDRETVVIVKDGENGASGNDGTNGKDAQYIYLKGTARDVNNTITTTIPCVVNVNGGTNAATVNRGLNLVTINRQTLAVVESINYDTYGQAAESSGTGITSLIDKLTALDNTVFVCLVSYDAVGWNSSLITALQNFGMGDLPYTQTGRYPFLFIGYKGLGNGNGLMRMHDVGAYTDVVELAAYVANGALSAGADGEDAVSIDITPASLIVNQDLQSPNNLSNLTQTFVVRVYKGDVEQTVSGISFVSETVPNSSPTAYKCLFLNGGGQRSGNSNIQGNVLTLKQINTYTQDGKTLYYDSMYADVTATYNTNKTITARIRIYANLLGTWAEKVEGDTNTAIANSITYLYDDNNPNQVVKQTNYAEYVRSSTEAVSTINKKLNNGKNLLSGVLTGTGFGSSTTKNHTPNPSLKGVTVDTDGYIITKDNYSYIYKTGITIERGKWYTVSFETKENQTAVGFCVFNYSGDGSVFSGEGCDTNCLPTTSGKKKTATFKVSGTGTVTVAFSINCTAIRYPQLELGETATAFDSGSTEMSSRIKQEATEISANVQTNIEGKLVETGVDIRGTERSITAKANNFTIRNNVTSADALYSKNDNTEPMGELNRSSYGSEQTFGVDTFGGITSPDGAPLVGAMWRRKTAMVAVENKSGNQHFVYAGWFTPIYKFMGYIHGDEEDYDLQTIRTESDMIVLLNQNVGQSSEIDVLLPPAKLVEGQELTIVNAAYKNISGSDLYPTTTLRLVACGDDCGSWDDGQIMSPTWAWDNRGYGFLWPKKVGTDYTRTYNELDITDYSMITLRALPPGFDYQSIGSDEITGEWVVVNAVKRNGLTDTYTDPNQNDLVFEDGLLTAIQ